MMSYYNPHHPFAMYQKNHSGSSNSPYTTSPSAPNWYSSYNPQAPSAAHFLGDSEGPPQSVYYPHHHVFHQSSPDWAGHENYAAPPQTSSLLSGPGSGNGGISGPPSGFLSINQATQNGGSHDHIPDGLQGLPSPPITVSGSDMSSPGAPNGSASPNIHSRPTPSKSPFEWMKKPSYQSQPNPGKKISFVRDLEMSDSAFETSNPHPHSFSSSSTSFFVRLSDNRK